MVVVITDGLENSSTDYTAKTLRDLIGAYDGRPNWTFVYLGAAHADLREAQDVAEGLSFERGNAMRSEAEPVAMQKSMGSLASATKHRRSAAELKSKESSPTRSRRGQLPCGRAGMSARSGVRFRSDAARESRLSRPPGSGRTAARAIPDPDATPSVAARRCSRRARP